MKIKAICISAVCLLAYALTAHANVQYINYKTALYDMAQSPDGTVSVVGANGRMYAINDSRVIKADYVTAETLTDVEYGNGSFCAISENSAYSSEDGVEWRLIAEGINAKAGTVFYFDGDGFVLEREERSSEINSGGLTWEKSTGLYKTYDFDMFMKIDDSLINEYKNDGRYELTTKTVGFEEIRNKIPGGLVYEFSEPYILSGNNVYRLHDGALVHVLTSEPEGEKEIIKATNGRYVKWVFGDNVKIYTSDDAFLWSEVAEPHSDLIYHCSGDGMAYYDVLWTGEQYLVRPTVCDNGYNPSGSSGEVWVCDDGFNLMDRITFDNYVLDMEYRDGRYYVLDITGITHTSDNLTDWSTEPGYMTFKRSNGSTLLTKKFTRAQTGFGITQRPVAVNINGEEREILFESFADGNISVSGEYFINVSKNKVFVSKDGVYWYSVELPKEGAVLSTYAVERTLGVLMDGVLMNFDISSLFPENSIHTEVGGKLLSFITEPVIEADRTLVPLRFIFETMGAQVDWENETRTAIVRTEDTEIRVSIDNTTAEVNGEPVELDVPARLINSKTLVPLRFLSEKLGYDVQWDNETRTAKIS